MVGTAQTSHTPTTGLRTALARTAAEATAPCQHLAPAMAFARALVRDPRVRN